jgi:hypothetical protein
MTIPEIVTGSEEETRLTGIGKSLVNDERASDVLPEKQ